MKDPQPEEAMELDPQVRPLLLSRTARTFLLASLMQRTRPCPHSPRSQQGPMLTSALGTWRPAVTSPLLASLSPHLSSYGPLCWLLLLCLTFWLLECSPRTQEEAESVNHPQVPRLPFIHSPSRCDRELTVSRLHFGLHTPRAHLVGEGENMQTRG